MNLNATVLLHSSPLITNLHLTENFHWQAVVTDNKVKGKTKFGKAIHQNLPEKHKRSRLQTAESKKKKKKLFPLNFQAAFLIGKTYYSSFTQRRIATACGKKVMHFIFKICRCFCLRSFCSSMLFGRQ